MINKIATMEEKDLTNSNGWGNYYGEIFTYTGRASIGDTSTQYAYGNIVENEDKLNSAVLTTGASNRNRAYNLYDVAGNVWEWTEESGEVYNTMGGIVNSHVNRGGCCYTNASMGGASYRYGDVEEMAAAADGFRVMLYIK